MRLLTRSDFDGLACAALLKEALGSDRVLGVHREVFGGAAARNESNGQRGYDSFAHWASFKNPSTPVKCQPSSFTRRPSESVAKAMRLDSHLERSSSFTSDGAKSNFRRASQRRRAATTSARAESAAA